MGAERPWGDRNQLDEAHLDALAGVAGAAERVGVGVGGEASIGAFAASKRRCGARRRAARRARAHGGVPRVGPAEPARQAGGTRGRPVGRVRLVTTAEIQFRNASWGFRGTRQQGSSAMLQQCPTAWPGAGSAIADARERRTRIHNAPHAVAAHALQEQQPPAWDWPEQQPRAGEPAARASHSSSDDEPPHPHAHPGAPPPAAPPPRRAAPPRPPHAAAAGPSLLEALRWELGAAARRLAGGQLRNVLEASQLAASVLFILLYVWSTYVPEAPGSWRYWLDLVLCCVFFADYVYRITASLTGGFGRDV